MYSIPEYNNFEMAQILIEYTNKKCTLFLNIIILKWLKY